MNVDSFPEYCTWSMYCFTHCCYILGQSDLLLSSRALMTAQLPVILLKCLPLITPECKGCSGEDIDMTAEVPLALKTTKIRLYLLSAIKWNRKRQNRILLLSCNSILLFPKKQRKKKKKRNHIRGILNSSLNLIIFAIY